MNGRLCWMKHQSAGRVILSLSLAFFLAGCLQSAPPEDASLRSPEGHRATYRATEEIEIADRDLTYTVLVANESGYLIHLQRDDGDRHDSSNWLYVLDREGFIRSTISVCNERTQDGECAWGDYHQFETWGRGWPFLCGALIPETGTYLRTDIADHQIRVTATSLSATERNVTIFLNEEERFSCTHSGAYPAERILTDSPPPGMYRGMVLQRGDPPFEHPVAHPIETAAQPLNRSPTVLLGEIPETSELSADDAVHVLRERSTRFASFADANPSGITPVINVFRGAGSVTLGPTVGPVQHEFAREQHYARELVFYGQDSGDLYRGVVQGPQIQAMDSNIPLPSESWIITDEELTSGYQVWSPLADEDGQVWSPRFQMEHAKDRAQDLGIVEGRIAYTRYTPIWSEPFDAEVEGLNACLATTDGRTSGFMLYSETVCISTATGQVTKAIGDWDLVRRAARLPDLDWEMLVR